MAATGAASHGLAAVALLAGAGAQLSPTVAGWAAKHSAWLAVAIVAIVAASFLAGLAVARRPSPLRLA
jgi:hypothetical protein